MKPTITISYTKICAAIRQNQGRAAILISPDGDVVLVDPASFKPANYALIDLPIGNQADVQAVNLINQMNGHGLSSHEGDAWRGQRIYGQSPASMFLFEYDFSQ